MIAVFVNPRSRANRKDPGLARRLAEAVGDAGRVFACPTLEALAADAQALAASPPRIIAVHGGDGTLHHTLTALLRAFGGTQALPPIALLGGGTMNVVSASLGIRAPALRFLSRMAEDARGNLPIATVSRRCLAVGDQFGFVFGNGLLANFLVEYYAKPGYGPGRAIWILAKLFVSAMVGGPLARRVFRQRLDRLRLDGVVSPEKPLTAISASTVREVGLGFKLNHRADDDPERFAVLAIHGGARALVPDVVSVLLGRGISPVRADSAVVSQMEIVAADADAPYTIDGDLYRFQGDLRVSIGPRLDFVDPRR